VGIASLVLGIGLIVSGFYLVVFYEEEDDPTLTPADVLINSIFLLIIGIAMIVGGVFFLRKYDKDRKKEKAENS